MSATVKKLQHLRDFVLLELNRKETNRDNDQKLIANVWHRKAQQDLGIDLMKVSAFHLMQLLIQDKLPSADSITRCRRSINQKDPSTRGKSYKARKTEEIETKNNIHKL